MVVYVRAEGMLTAEQAYNTGMEGLTYYTHPDSGINRRKLTLDDAETFIKKHEKKRIVTGED